MITFWSAKDQCVWNSKFASCFV